MAEMEFNFLTQEYYTFNNRSFTGYFLPLYFIIFVIYIVS